MAIAFGRMEYLKRSQGKVSVQTAAYIDRCEMKFDGNIIMPPCVYNWSEKEQPIYKNVFLPAGVNEKFRDPEYLWNSVEKFEVRKDSQVGYSFVFALPDDLIVSIEDKKNLIDSFVEQQFTLKGYAAHAVIHQPEKNSNHNWHCHIIVPPRTFNASGEDFNKVKTNDLSPSLRGAKKFAVDGTVWGKVWAQHMNEYFEKSGIDLRVDFENVLPQNHLGPVRLRGKKSTFELMKNDEIEEKNLAAVKNFDNILNKITHTHAVFTEADVFRFFSKHVKPDELMETLKKFWENNNIVQLYSKNSPDTPLDKYSSIEVFEEERKILRLAERIYARDAFAKNTKQEIPTLKQTLNFEQLKAFESIISGKGISFVEGYAGTGKSVLLVALKDHYESLGYQVRAFGPDSATAEVLKSKGFSDAMNVHSKLWKVYHGKMEILKGKEVWLIDEAGKLGNRPLLELLKIAEKKGVQLCFAGNSTQLESVERGGAFRYFCKRFGCVALKQIQRQKNLVHREISLNLATGKINDAINMISKNGGFNWFESSDKASAAMIERWAEDRRLFPFQSQLMVTLRNNEVRELNEMAHLYLLSQGDVSSKEFQCHTPNGVIFVSENDRILFKKNDNRLGVVNGESGVLIKASENQFVVRVGGGKSTKEISFNPNTYSSFQLGYAVSTYKSQGDTVDRVYIKYDKFNSRALFYVSETRHKETVECFVSKTEARFLSDIKFQVSRDGQRDTTLDFTSSSEIKHQNELDREKLRRNQLSKSDSVIDNVRGAWIDLKSVASNFSGKILDRIAERGFYQQENKFSEIGGGKVVEVKQETGLDVNELIKTHSEEPLPTKTQFLPMTKQASNFSKLEENERIITKQYFEKCDQASELHSLVKLESKEKGISEERTSMFADWQKYCRERNASANTLFGTVEGQKLKEALGAVSYEIISDRSHKYEKSLKPKINIEEQLIGNLEFVLHKLFPEGPSGKDSKSLRFGTKGSLSVICRGQKTGCFYDFSENSGGGILQLIEKRLGCSHNEARQWGESLFDSGTTISFLPKKYSVVKAEVEGDENSWKSLIPPKEKLAPSLAQISAYLDSKFVLISKHSYYDKSDNLAMYVLRLKSKSGEEKAIFPLSYGCRNGDESLSQWSLKKYQFKEKTSLYNSLDLKIYPEKTVLVVEGEKSADVGAKLFGGDIVTVSWLGGASAVKKADWAALSGRNVIIWPDNDPAGFKAADEISVNLRRVGVGSLKVVSQQTLKDFPSKWDIADSLPEGKDVEFLKECLHRAEQKAIGLDRLSSLLLLNGKNGSDKYEMLRLNELVSRVDERLRSTFEKEFGSKTWEIENKILAEVSEILKEKNSTCELSKHISGHEQILEALSYHGMLYRAKTGEKPSFEVLSHINKSIIEVYSAVEKKPVAGNQAHNLALEKTCIERIEKQIKDTPSLRENYYSNLESSTKINQKTASKLIEKDKEIVISHM